jgi:hypothetical protein
MVVDSNGNPVSPNPDPVLMAEEAHNDNVENQEEEKPKRKCDACIRCCTCASCTGEEQGRCMRWAQVTAQLASAAACIGLCISQFV